MKNKLLLLIAICIVVCSPLYAAGGSIHGTITAGPNSTPFQNARIVLRGGGHEQTALSNSDGGYEFSSLDASATYSLAIEGDGLLPFTKTSIALHDGEVLVVDANLVLADVHTSVLVTEGVVNLEAASAEVSQTISHTEVQELPTVTRNVAKYALLDPHVRQAIGLGSNYQDANRLSINAGSYRHTSYMLDGTTNYDWVYAVAPQATISAASVDEVKVLTGNYSAQYGNSTTGIIAVRTPSGTNTLHGNLFSYVRPSGIQAEPVLATSHIPNQKLDWGAAVGGPIISDRTFYYGSYEQSKENRGAVITLPTSTFFDGESNEYAGLFRLDHNLTNKNTLTTRLNGWHYSTNNATDRIAGGNQPSFGRTSHVQSWGGQIADQAVIGNMVNVARFTYTNYVPDSATPLNPSVGVVINTYPALDTGKVATYQAGYSTFNWVHAQTESASDQFAFRKGSHNLTFGGEFVHLHVKDYSFTPFGTYTFADITHFNNNDPDKYAQTFGTAYVRYGQKELSAFVQDDFSLTSRLTANVGLRYEFQSITASHHNLGPRLGLAWDVTGDGKTVVRAAGGMFFDQYYMYLNRRFVTLGPNSPQASYTWNRGDSGMPTYPQAALPTPDGGSLPAKRDLYIPADKLLNPYSIQFSASVQRELTHRMVLTLSGLQVHTLDQMRVNDINHPTPYVRTSNADVRPTSTIPGGTIGADDTRPFQTFDGLPVRDIAQIENSAASIYQSFDAGITEHFSRRVNFSAHYVLSSSVGYSMFYADANSGVPNDWVPNWDRYERGPGDFYQRHRFITDAVVRGPHQTTLSLVGNFGSGLPVNPITGVDNNGDSYKVDRPIGMGRNSFRTPSFKTVDLALGKRFTVWERLSTEARVEALNVFNSKNFITVRNTFGTSDTPQTGFLAPIAGITNSDPSRQLQFVVRVLF